jgi:hypothetical protein
MTLYTLNPAPTDDEGWAKLVAKYKRREEHNRKVKEKHLAKARKPKKGPGPKLTRKQRAAQRRT